MTTAVPPPSWIARWRHALKVGSWPKLLTPSFLGIAIGIVAGRRFAYEALVFVLAYTVLDIAFIVLLNDWGDREVDRIKRVMFPDGCSPKTIPDGILPARAVLSAALLAGAAAVLVAFVGEWVLPLPGLGAMGLVGLAVFWAYTLPPLRLNYRGGGELLEGFGVGGALVAFHVYAQCGRFPPLLFAVLPGSVLAALASAVASGLSDEESDRRGGKTTVVTALGNRVGRRVTEILAGLVPLAWLLAAFVPGSPLPVLPAVVASLAMLPGLVGMRRTSETAATNAFAAQAHYKAQLHQAVWYGSLALGCALLASYILWEWRLATTG